MNVDLFRTVQRYIQCESKKSPPEIFLHFSPNAWEFLVQILHAYYTFLSTLDYKFFIQLSPTMTKLCHIKCDHPANIYISLELLNLAYLLSKWRHYWRHIRHVCWHYKSVCSLLINFYEWVKYPTNCTDFIIKDQWPPNSPDLNPLDYHVWGAMLQAFHKLQSKPKTIPELKSALQQIWDDLPQTTINKAINDFRKRLNACVSADGAHFEHMMCTGWSRLIWHNFVIVGDNWIKICNLA